MYFYDEKRDSLKPKEGKLTECFRVRKKDAVNYITYKVDRFDENGKWLYSDEEETEINNFDTTVKIISHLGLKPLIEIDNIKHTFLQKDMKLSWKKSRDWDFF